MQGQNGEYWDHVPYARVLSYALHGIVAAETDLEWGRDVVAHHVETEWVTVKGKKIRVCQDGSRRGLVAELRAAHIERHRS